MISRLETMVLMGLELPVSAIRRQIASGIDIMVHLGRMRNHSRKVLEILEITGYRYETDEICTRTLFEFAEEKGKEDKLCGKLERREPLMHTQKLQRAGMEVW